MHHGVLDMSGFAQSDNGKEIAKSRRAAHRPSLSVILLSMGERGELEHALAAVSGRCRRMEAEIVVVRAKGGDDCAPLKSAYPCARFLEAPSGSESLALRQLGVDHARGDIIALREDGSVGDCMWLDALQAIVGTVDDGRPLEVEVAVAVSVEGSATAADRRRGRTASYVSSSQPPQRRRGDFGRSNAALADVPTLAPTLGSEM